MCLNICINNKNNTHNKTINHKDNQMILNTVQFTGEKRDKFINKLITKDEFLDKTQAGGKFKIVEPKI